ncbi:MAG: nucleotidyltransferase domain-containing protein [bacterium]
MGQASDIKDWRTMRFHNLLQDLIGSKAQIEILRTLAKYPGKIFSGREVAKVSGVSKTRTAELLSVLERNNVVNKQKIGNTYGWSVNQDSVLVSFFMQDIANLDKKVMNDLKNEIKKRFNDVGDVSKLIMFGSVAWGGETFDSDIDLLVLLKAGAKRKDAQKRADELNLLAMARYGNPISVNIYTEAEYEKDGLNEELKRRIAEEGVVLIER